MDKTNQIELSQCLKNRGAKKYLNICNKLTASLNESKIQEDSLWDGLHGMITNAKEESGQELLSSLARNLGLSNWVQIGLLVNRRSL